MNKIELVNALLHETGNESYDIESVSSTNPDHRKYITWIDRAYNSIQTKPVRWRWMLTHHEGNILVDKQSYTLAELGTTDFQDFLYTSFGILDGEIESPVRYIGQKEYDNYFRGSTTTSDKPSVVYLDASGDLIFYPKPTKQTVVRFDYFKRHIMTEDTHVPKMPVQYHELILFLACRYAAVRDNNPELFQDAAMNYNQMYKEMYKRESLILL